MHKNVRAVLDELGEPYVMKLIDWEECVYRDLGDHDIEVSGCRKKRGPFYVYVWKKRPLQIVYRSGPFKTLADLKVELGKVVETYSK